MSKKQQIALAACGVSALVVALLVWFLTPTVVTPPTTTPIVNTNVTSPESKQVTRGSSTRSSTDIQTLLRATPPQFIEYPSQGENLSATLSPELQNVTTFAGHVLLGDTYAPDNASSGLSVQLLGVSPRYIVAVVLSPKDTGSLPQIIDTKTQTATPLPGYIEFTAGSTAVMVCADNTIYTYTLGEASVRAIPNTHLSKGESYDRCLGGCLGSEIIQTHSTTTATFTVWRWDDEQNASVKSREVTFSFL